jgi:SAM-dependent methyltransferase
MTRWDERYRRGQHLDSKPSALVIAAASLLPPGRALDLACGPGRNAVYLASRGWRVTAVDSSPVALGLLKERAAAAGVEIDAVLADLEAGGFTPGAEAYDLVCVIRYLQRDLFSAIRASVRPGGLAAAEALLEGPHNPAYLAAPGELRAHFAGWEILQSAESATATILARKPRH